MIQKIFGRYGRSRQFYWWLCSYVVILMLAIIVNMIGYMVTMRVLESEVEKNNQSALANIRTVCDNHFDEVMTGSYSLLRSSSVQRLARENLSSYERQFYSQTVLNDMTTGVLGHQGVELCAVIIRNLNICVHSDLGSSNLDMAYETYFKDWFESKDAWLGQVFSVSGAEFLPLRNAAEGRQLFGIYCVPTINRNVAIMTKVKPGQVTELLQGADKQGEKGFLLDEAGGIIFSSDPLMDLKELPHPEPGDRMQTYQGVEYIVNYKASEATPFQYVRMVPNEVYLKSVKNVRNAFILGYLLCILLAGSLAYWFAALSERNKKKVDAELMRQKNYMRQNLMRQVLTGRTRLTSPELNENYPFLTHGNYIVVMLFDFLPLESDQEDRDGELYDYAVLAQYLTKQFTGVSDGENLYFCVVDEMCAGVLTLEEETGVVRLKEYSNDVCLSLNREMNLDLRCSISQPAESAEKLHESYEQALEIINLRFLGDKKTVFLYDDVLQEYPSYTYTAESKEKLIGVMQLGEYVPAEEMINQLLDVSGQHQRVNLSILRVLVSELFSTLLRAAAQIDVDETLDFRELYRVSMQISNYHQIQVVKETILHYVQQLCQIGAQNRPEGNNSKYQKVAEYIEENFNDPQLNVNMIADVFHINRSWLSKNFREKMGISLSDYILKCRIKKAKELLRTDKTVTQIAAEVGFASEVVYYRAFKKCENITSLQYRKLLQIEAEH